MPNTPSLVGEGVSVFALGKHVADTDGEVVDSLLKTLGMSRLVKESLVEPISGLSGSGVAYVSRSLCHSLSSLFFFSRRETQRKDLLRMK